MFLDGAIETAEGMRFKRMMKQIEKLKIDVGYNEQSGSVEDENGKVITIAQIAAWNEFGTERAPSRPFMRQTIDNDKDEIQKFSSNALKSVMATGGDASKLLNKIGSHTKSRIQLQIRDGEFEPNAPSTLAKKAPKTKPLIDTGRMRQNVVYVIKEK